MAQRAGASRDADRPRQRVLMLHFGVAQDARGFRLELVSRNMQTSLQDAAGELPASGQVIEEGPELLAATLPAERIAARLLGLGYPCATSDNAGTYLCNALLYHSAHRCPRNPRPAPHRLHPYPGGPHRPRGRRHRTPPQLPARLAGAVPGGLEIIATCWITWPRAARGKDRLTGTGLTLACCWCTRRRMPSGRKKPSHLGNPHHGTRPSKRADSWPRSRAGRRPCRQPGRGRPAPARASRLAAAERPCRRPRVGRSRPRPGGACKPPSTRPPSAGPR